jgi:hypothetical protein
MTATRIPRRFFLRGLGGATLALPVLPSIFRTEEARAAALANNKCFVALLTVHGGVSPLNMYPADSALTVTQSYATAGFSVRSGPLVAAANNGMSVVSPVLSAATTALTPALVAKMNILRGLDIPYQFSHHDGRGSMGNIVLHDGTTSTLPANPQRRSIDQVMAWSPNFYSSTAGVQDRSVHLHSISYPCYGYANPSVGASSGIQGIGRTANDSRQLFDSLFPTPPPSGPVSPRPLLVDLVLQDYQRLRNGNKRMSAADKARLDDYMQRIFELQRRVNTSTAPACTHVTRPTMANSSISGAPDSNGDNARSPYDGSSSSPALQTQYYQMYNDVLSAALQCGATRIAVVLADALVSDFSTVPAGLWHDTVAHNTDAASGQATMVAAQNAFFSGVVVDLAQKLDAASEGDGTTTLDRTLLMWTQEYGNAVHDMVSIPVVTFGSAGGAMKTGQYCDYRNRTQLKDGRAPGLTWHQMLGSFLQVMGVPRSEYQETNHNGYGVRVADPATDWPQPTWDAAGDLLPFL